MFLNYTVTSFEGVNALSFSTGWDAHGVWELDDDMGKCARSVLFRFKELFLG